MENLINTDKTLEKEKAYISDDIASLPTDIFLSKHIYKTDALLKFEISEMIRKKDLSRTQLIGVLEYITNLK